MKICAGLATVALLVSGCGSDEQSDFPNRNEAAIDSQGHKTLRKGNAAEPSSLDPAQVADQPGINILNDLYEGLVTYDPGGRIVPGVAKSWRVSDDGKTYIFHLDDDAHWSNGAPVKARDFVFSLRRAVDPELAATYADMHRPILNAAAILAGDKDPETLGVKALDDHTLEIRLARRTPYFLDTLAHASSLPVYPPAVKKHGQDFTRPGHSVTNGAYKLDQWRLNDKLVIKRNSHYRADDSTRIDKVIYYPITDFKAELARYQAGDLDFTYKVPTDRLPDIKKHIPEQHHNAPGLGIYYLSLNVTQPPFKNNPKLRQALSMALDRQTLVHKVLNDAQKPAYGFIPDGLKDYEGVRYQWQDWPDDKRRRMARRLYHEAGYSDEHPLKVTLLYPSNVGKKPMTVAAAMWREVLGARIKLKNMEWKAYLAHVNKREDTQIVYDGTSADYPDANAFLTLLTLDSGQNHSGYDNADYDQLQQQIAHQAEGAERARKIGKAEAMILQDSPVIPLYFGNSHHLVKPYVTGFESNALGTYPSRYLDIEPEED